MAPFFPHRRRHDLEAPVAYGAYRARSADRARIPPRLSASALTVWEWEGGAAVAMRSDKEET